jgi:fucose 4-O-acetylase-like acetyltransferase
VHVLSLIATAAAVVVALTWLVVSFSAPTPRRRGIEWLGATSLYVALLAFFVNLLRRAIVSGSEAGMIGFGFLTTVFAIGLVISVWKMVAALRGRAGSDKASATH